MIDVVNFHFKEFNMKREYRKVLKKKYVYSRYCILICSMCLFLFTGCETKQKKEQSSQETEDYLEQPEPSITHGFTVDTTENENDEGVEPSIEVTTGIQTESLINTDGQTIMERFQVPEGYTRVESEEDTFAYYLQNLPLKQDGTKVKYYDGREKSRDVYLAVVDYSLGDRDLQQCADAVIRLRAEYLYEMERYDEINFNFVSGFTAEFSKWSDGYGISVSGNNVSWNTNSNNNSSYESFQKYLTIVYAYASTLSLEKELISKSFSDIAIGDVFIQGGSPGHCVIVVDMAINDETGEKIFMLAQSYMPAQDIQILKGENDSSPWFYESNEEILQTPEWTFEVTDLKTWE